MTKKLSWRLSKLPTPDEVRELVKDKIITQDEARNILFSSEEEGKRDEESLKSEIKFLRELVEKLSKSHGETTTIIREIERPYYRLGWYRPYEIWCNSSVTTNYLSSTGTATLIDGVTTNSSDFVSIKTF